MQTATSGSMVSSNDVNGTAVYSPSGDRLGDIDHVMIDKKSGTIAYAVMGFGGFLGMGEDHHPVPWGKLKYDTTLGGYVTDITREQLEGAPVAGDGWADNSTYAADSYRYYGLNPFWV